MRLPVIKHISNNILQEGVAKTQHAIEVLENLAESSAIKDNELDVIGELISNMYGAIDVANEVANGTPQKEALNGFMKRVLGSIDR